MRVDLLCVGRPRNAAAIRLHDEYASRLTRLGVEWSSTWVAEVRMTGRYSDEHVRQREARALAERLEPQAGSLIALDRNGRQLASDELAGRLERWAARRATFVIGGPLGLHDDLLERADWRWSLSRLTFPHELARVLVAEQVYRALTLLRGLPYHR